MKKEILKETIVIPKGCFSGDCTDCRYADWSDTDSYGRVYCRGPYGGYNYPKNRSGCIHHKER